MKECVLRARTAEQVVGQLPFSTSTRLPKWGGQGGIEMMMGVSCRDDDGGVMYRELRGKGGDVSCHS